MFLEDFVGTMYFLGKGFLCLNDLVFFGIPFSKSEQEVKVAEANKMERQIAIILRYRLMGVSI